MATLLAILPTALPMSASSHSGTIGCRAFAMARSQWLPRRELLVAAIGSTVFTSQPAVADVRFAADDQSFRFELPEGWVGQTPPEQERVSNGHLISVYGQKSDGSATMQALVDGGFRGRKYGTNLKDLGPLNAIANSLVSQELLNDAAAKSAALISAEQTENRGGMNYYIVRYQVDSKPALAKLAIAQQRLYVLKVKATKPASQTFFDEDGALQADMAALAESYAVENINSPCLGDSNKGNVPTGCKTLRP